MPPTNTAAIPADLVTDSGSGLDRYQAAAAEYQLKRVAKGAHLAEDTVGSGCAADRGTAIRNPGEEG